MNKKRRVLAITRTPESQAEFQALRDEILDVDFDAVVDDLDRLAPTIVNSHAPDVLLVELGLDDPDELECLSTVIKQNHGMMPVITSGTDASLADIRRLMQMGVTDFVPRPVSRKDLAKALETAFTRISQRNGEPSPEGKIISFMKASGGVGATTLAIEAAAQLMNRRKRQKASVCVLDLDLQFGSVAWSLDIPSQAGLGTILEAGERVDDEFIKTTLTRHGSGLDVLASPSQIHGLDAMTPELAHQLIHFARQHYEYAVVDLPSAWTNWGLEVVAHSDALALVTELDVTAMARTRKQLEFLSENNLENLPIRLVLNRYPGGWSLRRRRKEAERGLGRRIDFMIGEDRKTACSARDRGEFVSKVSRRSPIVRDVRRFLDEMTVSLDRQAGTDRPILVSSA